MKTQLSLFAIFSSKRRFKCVSVCQLSLLKRKQSDITSNKVKMLTSHRIHSIQIEPSILKNVITEFRRDINSPREESKIFTIVDLIHVLNKRNILRKQTCETVLQNLFLNFDRSEREIISDYLRQLVPGGSIGNKNNYGILLLMQTKFPVIESMNILAEKRQQHHQEITKPVPEPESSSENDAKRMAFKLIAKEMVEWRNFCRELGQSEARIRAHEESRADIETITHRVLLEAEEQLSVGFKEKLIHALIEIRQKKLVQKLVSNGFLPKL